MFMLHLYPSYIYIYYFHKRKDTILIPDFNSRIITVSILNRIY